MPVVETKITKKVRFGPNEIIAADGQRSQEAALEIIPQLEKKTLDTKLLCKIESLYFFAGLVRGPEPATLPTLLFKADYYTGTTGWVHCPLLIRGDAVTIDQAFHMYTKIRFAKELIPDDIWVEMEGLFGYTKQTAMIFEWYENKTKNKVIKASAPVKTTVKTTDKGSASFITWLDKWGYILGFLLGFAFGFGLGFGLALALKMGFQVAFGTAFSAGVSLGLVGTAVAQLSLHLLVCLRVWLGAD